MGAQSRFIVQACALGFAAWRAQSPDHIAADKRKPSFKPILSYPLGPKADVSEMLVNAIFVAERRPAPARSGQSFVLLRRFAAPTAQLAARVSFAASALQS